MKHPHRYRRIATSVLAVAIGLASAGVQAGGHRGHGPDFGPERIMHLMERLDVSGAQRDQIFAIIDEVQPEMRKLMFARHDAHKTLRGILADGAVDTATVETLATQAGQDAARMVRLTAGMMGRISALLTPAQRAELKEMMAKHGPR